MHCTFYINKYFVYLRMQSIISHLAHRRAIVIVHNCYMIMELCKFHVHRLLMVKFSQRVGSDINKRYFRLLFNLRSLPVYFFKIWFHYRNGNFCQPEARTLQQYIQNLFSLSSYTRQVSFN